MKKERIDVLLVEKGLIETREKAKRTVMAGLVLSDGERIDKPGAKVAVDSTLTLKGQAIPYVSRGGLKLEKAINVFGLQLADKTMLDIGASTGGFTDCALQKGAKKVYALDVGYNQLAWKLRQDDRVVVMERTNFRYASLDDFSEGRPDVATIDVSFISLRLILPVLKTILADGAEAVCLVKPQFEAGRNEVGKKGVVRDRKVHAKVADEIVRFCEQLSYTVNGLIPSPVRGGEGNIEFLLHLSNDSQTNKAFPDEGIKKAVDDAHSMSYDKRG